MAMADAVGLLAVRVDLALVGFRREFSGHLRETSDRAISDAGGPMSSHVEMATGIALDGQTIAHRNVIPETDARIAAGLANSADEAVIVADSVAQAEVPVTEESTSIPLCRSTMTACHCGADFWRCRN